MVVQYIPMVMVGLAALQSILLICICVQVHRLNKQQISKQSTKSSRDTQEHSVASTANAPTVSSGSSRILPWLSQASRDDMIESFRVLAAAQQNERK